MRQSLASPSFINNERLFKESQKSYSKKNQNVFFSFFLSFFFFFFWPGRSRTSDSWIRSQTRSRCYGLSCKVYMSHRMTKPTKWPLHPAKTQISLCIHPVWSESSLSAWRNIGSSATHWAPRLILVVAGHKGHFLGFVMRWLTFRKCIFIFASGLRNKPHFWRLCL